MSDAATLPVSLADIVQARRRLDGVAVRTPLIEYPVLGEQLGGQVIVKFEGAQREGSFKFRGAYNRLVQLTHAERACGVVAWSSGNHAQGVAGAARRLGIPAAIVMPSDAPAVKIANTLALGAEVVVYDRLRESREAIARRLAEERGAVLVPSFDDRDVIAGQGTIGLEILDQARMAGHRIDQLLVPCGGGGLAAGVALAVRSIEPGVDVFAVEPEGFDDTARSLIAGERVANAALSGSLCDALLAPMPGELTFAINSRYLAGGLAVSDAQVRAAVAFAHRSLKLVTEPGGAVALAAILSQRIPIAGRSTAIIISGSNIDPELLSSILAEAA